MCRIIFFLLTLISLLMGCTKPPKMSTEMLRQEVFETERAFAQTMAKRDFQAFTAYLSEEAVFFSGPTPLHGKNAVADWWKQYYVSDKAPFSWEPEKVEVLQSGTLALSTGKVRNSEGNIIGEFTSIWRKKAPGKWHIVFDKGNQVCGPEKP